MGRALPWQLRSKCNREPIFQLLLLVCTLCVGGGGSRGMLQP